MLSERSHSTPVFLEREKADLWLPVFRKTVGKGSSCWQVQGFSRLKWNLASCNASSARYSLWQPCLRLVCNLFCSIFHRSSTGMRFLPCSPLKGASLGAQRNPPAMWETWVRSLDWEDPLGGHGNPLQYSCLDNPHGQRRLLGFSPRGRKEFSTGLSDKA